MTIDTKRLREKVTGKNVIEIAAAINYGTFLQLLDDIDLLREQLAMVEAECRELLDGFTCDDDYQMAIRDGHEEAAERILAVLKRVPELE